MAIPETWWLKEGSELEINGKKVKILKLEIGSTCEDKFCKPLKKLHLENDLVLEVTDEKTQLFLKGKETALKSIKILKK